MFKRILNTLNEIIKKKKNRASPLIVVLSGISQATNIGDNSMLISLVNHLKQLEPNSRIVVLVENPESCKNIEDEIKVTFIKSLQNFIKVYLDNTEYQANEATIIRELAFHIISNKDDIIKENTNNVKISQDYTSALKHILLADGVIDCGGACFTPLWKSWFYERCFYYLISPKPLFSVGQGIDHFDNPDDIKLMKFALSNATNITLRENLSYEYLKSLGFDQNIYLTGDESLTLIPSNTERLNEILGPLGMNVFEPYIAFHFRYFVEYAQEKYFDILAKYVDEAIRSLGLKVLGIPMFYDRKCDERKHLFEISKRVNNKNKFNFPDIELNPGDVKGLFKYAQVAFGISYHSAVFSLSTGTPYIGLYEGNHYSQKMIGLSILYNISTLPLHITSTTPKEFGKRLAFLCNNRSKIGIMLKKRNHELLSRVEDIRKKFLNEIKGNNVHYN